MKKKVQKESLSASKSTSYGVVFFFLKMIQECTEPSNYIMPNVDTEVARKSCCHWKTFSSLFTVNFVTK